MTQPISSLMQRQVSVVEMDQTVGQVEALFAERELSWAPVLAPPGEVVGVVSAHDLVQFHVQGRVAGVVSSLDFVRTFIGA